MKKSESEAKSVNQQTTAHVVIYHSTLCSVHYLLGSYSKLPGDLVFYFSISSRFSIVKV